MKNLNQKQILYDINNFKMLIYILHLMIYGNNGKIIQVYFEIKFKKKKIFFVIVYNWTTDNVIDWLVNYVHLPQYVNNFRRNQIDGRMIPR